MLLPSFVTGQRRGAVKSQLALSAPAPIYSMHPTAATLRAHLSASHEMRLERGSSNKNMVCIVQQIRTFARSCDCNCNASHYSSYGVAAEAEAHHRGDPPGAGRGMEPCRGFTLVNIASKPFDLSIMVRRPAGTFCTSECLLYT